MGAMTMEDGAGGARVARLSERVHRLRLGQQADVTKVLSIVGIALLPLGFVLIGIGWYGAAHSTYPTQSISYLISGGLGGVAMVVVGCALFFGASLIRQERRFERAMQVFEENSQKPQVTTKRSAR